MYLQKKLKMWITDYILAIGKDAEWCSVRVSVVKQSNKPLDTMSTVILPQLLLGTILTGVNSQGSQATLRQHQHHYTAKNKH